MPNKIIIPDNELKIIFSRSAGRGGQNVNKVSTKACLRWNIWRSQVLNQAEKQRVVKRWTNKVDQKGNFIIYSQSERSQHQNKLDAINKLQNFIKSALKPIKKRIATKPSFGAKERRLKEKKRRTEKKKLRKIEFS